MVEASHNTSSEALADSIDANLIEKSLSFAKFFGGKIYGPNPVWFVTGKAMPGNNGVVSATFAEDDLDERIRAIVRPFKARGRPLTWWVGPRTTPFDLGKYLQQHGFIHNRDMIGMAMALDKLHLPNPAPELSLERVETVDMLQAWYAIILDCFPSPYSQSYFDALAAISLRPDATWIHYVGQANGDIVSASSLFLGGGVAGLYNLGTYPKVRNLGFGALTTIKTFLAARDIGYHLSLIHI